MHELRDRSLPTAKAGKPDEALERARGCFAETPHDLFLQRAYGWVIYDLVKREVEALKADRSSPGRVANRFNEWLAEYHQFGENDRPGMLHSLLLNQVLKGSRAWPGFLEFARWWGPEYLTADDRKPYVLPNGKEAPSLAMRYFYAIGREASHLTHQLDSDLIAWAEAQVEAALAEAPDDQWLHYYKSKLLLDRGQIAQARECLMPVVRRQQCAAWVWTLLGQTFELEDPSTSITCYFRAVQLAGKPQEVANTRIALARLLAAGERYEEAAMQVRRALEYRIQNDFQTPQELWQMAGSDWYRKLAGRNDLPCEPDVTEAADATLYGGESMQIEYRLGVIDNQNPEKALAHVAFSSDDGSVLHYKKFKGIADAPVGEIVDVGFAAGEKQPIRWHRSEATAIEGLCRQMTGKVTQRPGQNFGFLITEYGERVFVHPDLMHRHSGGLETQARTCVAMMGKDKQGKPGWRALRWIEESS